MGADYYGLSMQMVPGSFLSAFIYTSHVEFTMVPIS